MKAYRQNVNRFKFILQWKIKWKLEWSARESTFLRRLPASCVLVQIRTRIMENKQNIRKMAIMSLHAIPYQRLLQIHQKFLKPSKGKLKVKRNFQRRKSENKSDKWVVVASRVTVSVDAITSAFYTKFMQPVKVSQQKCSHFFQKQLSQANGTYLMGK